MNNYQYILLDWDGNLAKTLDIWMEATQAPLRKRGIHLTDLEVGLQVFGRPREAMREMGVTDVDEAIEEMDQMAMKLLPEVELYPDAMFVLEELRNADKKTALITASRRKNVMHLLDKYNIHRFFDVVITGEDTERHKPDPEPLELALKELDGDKEQAIMIGDSDKDIGAANNIGIDSILFYPDGHERFYKLDELKKFDPTHIVHDFRDVTEIIK